jgi:hypothetical protein
VVKEVSLIMSADGNKMIFIFGRFDDLIFWQAQIHPTSISKTPFSMFN